MTPLSAIFVDASESARNEHRISTQLDRHLDLREVTYGDNETLVFTGTRAECERWVADRAAKAGFAAVRNGYKAMSETNAQWYSIAQFLEQLAEGE